jgi:GNAT superfamily N-acetyltransferase
VTTQLGSPEARRAAVSIRPLAERDLPTATRILCTAFGTFVGAPEPETFWRDLDYVGTRWLADPAAAFGAEIGGELVGSNFATLWGSVGCFGPLTVRPDLWDQGIGKRLMEPVIDLFDRWGVTHAGLFTFPHSAKHIALYQKYGFWPRFLTPIMSKPVQPPSAGSDWSRYSEVPEADQGNCCDACRKLTNAILEGLDVEREIRAVRAQALGDTVLLQAEGELVAFAVCHCGAGTEAGNEACYVKFGAVRPRPDAGQLFDRLLDACEALAAAQGMARLVLGVNIARHQAYRRVLARGFRTELQGVVMQRPNEPGYNRPEVYLIDDWR